MKERSSHIDFISGVLILYMVFIHVCQWFGYGDSIFYLNSYKIFGFLMPWFFFKGGMFFQYRNIKDVVINSFKRLVKPYILWSLIGLSIYIIFEISKGTNTFYLFKKELYSFLIFGSFFGNLPLWFLISLFCVRIAFCMMPKNFVVALIMSSIILGYVMNYIDIPQIPYLVANTSTGIFYFAMGYKLKNYQYERKVFAVSIVVYLLILFTNFTRVDMRSNQVMLGSYWLWPIISLTGIVCLNNIVKEVFEKIDLERNFLGRTISTIGKYSMGIYVIHWPILLIIYNLLEQFKII